MSWGEVFNLSDTINMVIANLILENLVTRRTKLTIPGW